MSVRQSGQTLLSDDFDFSYPYGEVQVDFQITKTFSAVVKREGVLAKSTIKSEGVSTEMTNEREASPPSIPSAGGLGLA